MENRKNEEKYPKVPISKKYGDVSFCTKEDCKFKSYSKHICHNSNRYYVSVIDYWKNESCNIYKECVDNEN